jgi:glycosyltransferase involved in cell wall biosynthesis
MAVALMTTYLAEYRVPLYERLAAEHEVEVLCYGRGDRYVPAWSRDLDEQLANVPFPAHRLEGAAEAFDASSRYDAVIMGTAGGAILPAAYAGARRHRKPFVLWASMWARPRSVAHDIAWPATRHIYRNADAVIAYGEHVRRHVARIRGRDHDVFVAPQSVEPELFARPVLADELDEFRARHGIGGQPFVLYVGRLVPEKGIDVLLDAWRSPHPDATLVLVGDGPLAAEIRSARGIRLVGVLPRAELPVAYAGSAITVVPSIPTRRFTEPWGLVCNEAMYQGRPVIASDAVGAVAGGLVCQDRSGVVVPAGDPVALANAIARLLADDDLRARLGAGARDAVAPYTYDAMADAFGRALRQSRPR